jgi:hypothetical protein
MIVIRARMHDGSKQWFAARSGTKSFNIPNTSCSTWVTLKPGLRWPIPVIWLTEPEYLQSGDSVVEYPRQLNSRPVNAD